MVSGPRKFCENALREAVEGGHLEAVKCLLAHRYEYRDVPESHEDAEVGVTRYEFDVVEALELAVKNEHHNIVEAICEKSLLMTEELYQWGADHGRLDVVEHVYNNRPNDFDSLFERGAELLDYVDGDDSFDCPLAAAVKQGTEEVLDYVYSWFSENIHEVFSYGTVAAEAGRLEWVKKLHEQHEIGAPELEWAFACAAGGNHLDVARFLQTRRDFNISSIDKAFTNAARHGQLEAVKCLCDIEGYQTSAWAFHEAFVDAAGGGHLDVVKLLDSRGRFSLRAISKAFTSAACNRVLVENRGGQVQVLAYLYAKECNTSELISDVFAEAASCSCVDVVEFLYSAGSISADLVNKAFQCASQYSCVEVAFLFKTGAVKPETVEKEFPQVRISTCWSSFSIAADAILRKCWRKLSIWPVPIEF